MKKEKVIQIIREVVSRGGIPDIVVRDYATDTIDKASFNSTILSENHIINNKNLDESTNNENNTSSSVNGQTLLHLAVKYDLQAEVLLLLTNGAPLYVKNNEGLTPERLAMKEGNQVMLQMLTRYKSHAKYVNKLGKGPNPKYNLNNKND